MPRWKYLLLAASLVACQPEADPEAAASADRPLPDPVDVYLALENRLLDVIVMRMDFHVTAEGAFQADIRGSLEIETGGRASLTGTGTFGPDSVDLFLRTEEAGLVFGNGASRKTRPNPSYLNESITIGLTRMGILHNLARLTGSEAPDHADGGALDWVVVGNLRTDTTQIGETYPITFDLTVDGEPSGTATLEIDREGYPVVRRQTVAFPDGEMRVVERYENVSIDP